MVYVFSDQKIQTILLFSFLHQKKERTNISLVLVIYPPSGDVSQQADEFVMTLY